MTPKQKADYNRMLHTLRRIHKDYQTSEELHRDSEKDWGLEFEEAIGMAYDNIQNEARECIKGVREIK